MMHAVCFFFANLDIDNKSWFSNVFFLPHECISVSQQISNLRDIFFVCAVQHHCKNNSRFCEEKKVAWIGKGVLQELPSHKPAK